MPKLGFMNAYSHAPSLCSSAFTSIREPSTYVNIEPRTLFSFDANAARLASPTANALDLVDEDDIPISPPPGFPSSDLTLVGSSPARKPLSRRSPGPATGRFTQHRLSSPLRSSSSPLGSTLLLSEQARKRRKPAEDEEEVEWPTLPARGATRQTRKPATAMSKEASIYPVRNRPIHKTGVARLSGVRVTTHEAPSRRKLTIYHPPPKHAAEADEEATKPLKIVRAIDSVDEKRLQRLLEPKPASSDEKPDRLWVGRGKDIGISPKDNSQAQSQSVIGKSGPFRGGIVDAYRFSPEFEVKLSSTLRRVNPLTEVGNVLSIDRQLQKLHIGN